MRPSAERPGIASDGRVCRAADQARGAFALVLLLALAGCGSVTRDVDPGAWWRNLSGAHLEGRQPPPGLDEPYPNLASVPPRPTPPDPATRASVTQGLAGDRAAAAEPLDPMGRRAPAVPAAGGAPAPPRLAAVPPIRLDPVPRAVPAPAPAAVPAAPPAAARAPVAEPLPEARGLPPAPAADMLAPPPPPSPDLLAPR